MSMHSIIIIATASALVADLIDADHSPNPDLVHQQIDRIAGAADAMTDDLNALFQSSRVSHTAENPTPVEEMDIPDLSANSDAGIGPQESMVLDDPSPLPPLKPAAYAHKHEKVKRLQNRMAQLNKDLDMEMPHVKQGVGEAKPHAVVDHTVSSSVNDACHAQHTTRIACNADTATTGGCTWCECVAVPSACWEKTNAAKLPRGVYTCDKNKPTDESKPEIKTSLLKTSDDLIGAVNKIVNGIVASSLGKFCAFPDCCQSTQDTCQQQISCVTATVDNSVSESDNVLGINKLADAAKACNSEDTMVLSAQKEALHAIDELRANTVCSDADCERVKTCVEDVGSSAMMFLLIVHSQHTNASLNIVADLDRDLHSCALFDSGIAARNAIAEGPIYSLLSTMHHVANHQPQVAVGFVSLMLLGIAIVIFAAVYSFERRKGKRARNARPPPVQIW